MWKEKIISLNADNSFSTITLPATTEQISCLETALKIKLPKDLKSFLEEVNGDGVTFLSVEQIIEDNLVLRNFDYCMPLNCLLFFAENGCGDYFGYSISGNGEIGNNIFLWDHEYDSRKWIANGLEDFIRKRKNQEF